jgi:hypothetical protein
MNYTRREAYGSNRNLLMTTLRQPCRAFATPITGGGSGACGDQGVQEDDFHQVKNCAGEGGVQKLYRAAYFRMEGVCFLCPFLLEIFSIIYRRRSLAYYALFNQNHNW